MLSGLFCAIAGILFSLRFASARYDAGTGLELNAVLIVLLGGISIFGGRGTMLGLVLAVCVIAALQSALTLDLMSPQDQNVVIGGLLVASVIVPNLGSIYRRARTRLESAAARRASRRRAAVGGARAMTTARVARSARASGSSASAWPPTGRSSRACTSGCSATSATSRSGSRALGADVVSAGLVDTAEGAREAGDLLAAGRVDVVMLYTATYATSAQVLPAVQAAKAPVVILNLQPTRSLDYEAMTTGEWLANCSACCVPELAGAFTRARIPYHTVTGTLLEGDPAWDRLRGWIEAAAAARGVRRARFGFLGHNYPGMLDMYSDFTQIQAQVGSHVEILEIDDLVARVEGASAADVRAQGRGDPRGVRARRAGRRPDRRRDRPRALRVVGARRRRARPRSCATSRWTGSPTTTAASATTSTSASAPG